MLRKHLIRKSEGQLRSTTLTFERELYRKARSCSGVSVQKEKQVPNLPAPTVELVRRAGLLHQKARAKKCGEGLADDTIRQ